MSDFRDHANALAHQLEEQWDEVPASHVVSSSTATTSPGAVTHTAETAAPSAAATAATAARAASPSAPAASGKRILHLLPRVEGSSLMRIAERDGTIVIESHSGTEIVRWAREENIRIERW